ncbi:hypothetical protein [Ciceribacter sp. RN22]|uniref:hypothetical protein n=1 Tax=Ciceribacter sp. RN22 TaxID=2954932 RepID=UPI002093BE70|nr:hypothetical protein [Ciceribacter sp. RN22]MCO6178813.1 hypothetical protein [Ciceribacter sp. RN22]
MSMFISIAYPDAVRMLTDGATYDLDGTLKKIGCKVHAHDTLPIAITGRGSLEMIDNFRDLLFAVATEQGTVDDFLKAIPATLDAAREKIDGRMHPTQHCEVVIAMWSETTGAQHRYFITTEFAGYSDVPRFHLHTPSWFFDAAPALAPENFEIVKSWVMQAGPDFPARCGADAVELWRRTPVSHPSTPKGPKGFIIGGQVDLTVISRKGVTTRTLRQWDDEIGRKIDPFHPRHSAHLAGMTRQQRRVLERQANRPAA